MSHNYEPLDEDYPNDGVGGLSFDSPGFEKTTVSWNHIHNLDEFFRKIYHYHQHAGFFNILLESIFSIVKLVVTFLLITISLQCVNYQRILEPKFGPEIDEKPKSQISTERNINWSYFFDLSPLAAASALNVSLWLGFAAALALSGMWLLIHLRGHWEVRNFLHDAIQLTDAQMCDMSWRKLEQRILGLQRQGVRLSVHKAELDALDVRHRLLRRENFIIGLFNQSLIPAHFDLPFGLGRCNFFTQGCRYNLDWLLFKLPGAPFTQNWQLRPAYKMQHTRVELARDLSRAIGWLAVFNLILSPLIFAVQLLVWIFENAELARSTPARFTARSWSNYALIQMRHFNELRHELQARLDRARVPANKYLDWFIDYSFISVLRIGAFISGALAAFLGGLWLLGDAVSLCPGYLALLAAAGLLARCLFNMIPEPGPWAPQLLLDEVIRHIHYCPARWHESADTRQTRDELAQLFVFRFQLVMQELLSPLIVPFWLMFRLQPRSLEIVDFLRNYTVESREVGDICNFASLNVQLYGHPQWCLLDPATAASEQSFNGVRLQSQYHGQVEHGKLEMSLLNFHLCNPHWKPPDEGGILRFLQLFQRQIVRDLRHSSSTSEVAGSMLAASSVLTPPQRLKGVLHSVTGDNLQSVGAGGAGTLGGGDLGQSFGFQAALMESSSEAQMLWQPSFYQSMWPTVAGQSAPSFAANGGSGGLGGGGGGLTAPNEASLLWSGVQGQEGGRYRRDAVNLDVGQSIGCLHEFHRRIVRYGLQTPPPVQPPPQSSDSGSPSSQPGSTSTLPPLSQAVRITTRSALGSGMPPQSSVIGAGPAAGYTQKLAPIPEPSEEAGSMPDHRLLEVEEQQLGEQRPAEVDDRNPTV